MIWRADSRRAVDAEVARNAAFHLMYDERPSGLWAQARDRYGDPRGAWHRVLDGRCADGTLTAQLSCVGCRWIRRLGTYAYRSFGGAERDPPHRNRCRRCLRRKEAR